MSERTANPSHHWHRPAADEDVKLARDCREAARLIREVGAAHCPWLTAAVRQQVRQEMAA